MGLSRLSRSVVGSRVLVTGAASGMGRATARLFADEGARVFLADWDREGLQVVTTEIRAMYGADSAGCQSGDVGKGSDRETLIAMATQFLGGLDILINNAGKQHRGAAEEFTDEAWHDIFKINVFNLLQEISIFAL